MRTLLALVLAMAPFLAQAEDGEARLALQVREAQLLVQAGGTFGPVGSDLSLPAQGWQSVALPHAVPRALLPDGQVRDIDIAWFRMTVPAGVQGVAPASLRVYVPRWQTIGQVALYVDGRLRYRSSAGPVWNGFNHPLWLPLAGPETAGTPREVVVRLDHLRGAGAALSSVWIGDEAGLIEGRWGREFLQSGLPFAASTGFLVIGLFALLVWLRRREAAYGLFFLCSGLFFVRCLHLHQGLEPLPVPEEWFGWATVQTLPALASAVNVFALRLAGVRLPRVEAAMLALIGLSAVASLPALSFFAPVAQLSPLIYALTMLAFMAFCAATLAALWRVRSHDGLLVATWNLINIPAGAHDWLLQNYRISIESVYLLPLTGIGLFSLFLFLVTRRYIGAIRRSEQAQHELERQLREREAELKATYDRLRAVEHEHILSAERQRLMQDMHDGLGSTLMGALRAVEHGGDADLAGVLRQCIDDLKLAIDSLEPAQADLLVLLGTLRFRLGTRLVQSGVHLHWNVEDVPPLPWLDPRSALHILRILQEVLGNVMKHSGACSVTVSTQLHDDHVAVTVQDDGRGFDPSVRSGGRGLQHVRQRAAAIGAAARWTSGPGGTTFELVLPLRLADAGSPALDQVEAK